MKLVEEFTKSEVLNESSGTLELKSNHSEVKVSLVFYTGEVELCFEDANGIEAHALGIRADGTIIRYIGQQFNLEKLGFEISNAGVIKLWSEENK